MYAFGIDMPLPEMLLILCIVLFIALIFIFLQVRHISYHVKVLEDTTLDVRKHEEEQGNEMRRFETDMAKLESEEAELFVTKIVPTVSKLENYVVAELLREKDPAEIKETLVKKGINGDLALKVINSMTYYLDFFHKMPDRKVDNHVSSVESIRVPK